MAGRPRKRARLQAEALAAIAQDNPDLQVRADIASAAVDLLTETRTSFPSSTIPQGTITRHLEQALSSAPIRRLERGITVEYAQDQALKDYLDRRELLLGIIDGTSTTTLQKLTKDGDVVTLELQATMTERLRGLELLARYSALGRTKGREVLDDPVKALAELLGLQEGEVKAMVAETPSWTMLDAPPL